MRYNLGMSGEIQGSYAREAHRAVAVEGTPEAKRIDVLVDKFKDMQFGGPMDTAHTANLAGNVHDFFTTFSRGYTSVERMEEIAVDHGRTTRQNENAMADLDILGKAVYESVREKPDFVELIGSGSASEIDAKLPAEFKRVGKLVLSNVFVRGPVKEILNNLDATRYSLSTTKSKLVREKQLSEAVKEAMTELRQLKNLTPEQSHDRQMATAYLGVDVHKVVTKEKTAAGKETKKIVDAVTTAGAENERREAERVQREADRIAIQNEAAEKEADRAKKAYFKAMFVAPIADTSQVGTQLDPEWVKAMDLDLSAPIKDLNNSSLVQGRASGLDEWLQSMWRAPDKVMDHFIRLPGVEWLAQDMLTKYFDVSIDIPKGPDSDDYMNVNFKGSWRLKKDPNNHSADHPNESFKDNPDFKDYNREWTPNDRVEDREWIMAKVVRDDFRNLDVLFENYSTEMIDGGMIPGATQLEMEANAAMALGIWGCLMRVSLLPDDANPTGSYAVNNFRTQVWTTIYPEEKGRGKYAFAVDDPDKRKKSESPWAEGFGDWLRAREKSSKDKKSHTHKQDVKFMEDWDNGVIKPLPKRLLVNYLTLTQVKVTSGPQAGKEQCMLRALREGWNIKYEDMGSSKQWISFHDEVRSAAGVFGFMSGKDKASPIQFGKTGGEWALALDKLWVYLRDKPELAEEARNTRNTDARGKDIEDHSPWAERVMWMMGADAGGFVDSPELVIEQGATSPVTEAPQSRYVMAIVDSTSMGLMLDAKDRKWIAKRLHAYYNDNALDPQSEHKKSYLQRKIIVKRSVGRLSLFDYLM